MSSRLNTITVQNPDVEGGSRWDNVVRLTFEACLHHSEGRQAIADRILRENLPEAIRTWSGACQSTSHSCKQTLRAMFSRVREQVAMASVQRRLILEEVSSIASTPPFRFGPDRLPEPRSSGGGRISLRQRIPIDDVSAMLDAVADAGAAFASERPTLAIPSSRLAISV
jgi:hypothetical protein